ncbi:hypothetical protein SHL15_7491 [Streptomyces hygroscopicus subsp. limoneus]|nr:hypothetical protein SHL15_7491 [Streptomyces hygroscopicus subsp. limoneus]
MLFDGAPRAPERLRTLRARHATRPARTDRKIAQLVQRQAEQEHGRRARPTPPDWIVELGIHADRPPVRARPEHLLRRANDTGPSARKRPGDC